MLSNNLQFRGVSLSLRELNNFLLRLIYARFITVFAHAPYAAWRMLS